MSDDEGSSGSLRVRELVGIGDSASLEDSIVVDIKPETLHTLAVVTLYYQKHDPRTYTYLKNPLHRSWAFSASTFSPIGIPKRTEISTHDGYILLPIEDMCAALYDPEDYQSDHKGMGQILGIGRDEELCVLRPYLPATDLLHRKKPGVDSCVSSNHCYISIGADGTVQVTDSGTRQEGSKHGTYMNGYKFKNTTFPWPQAMLIEIGFNIGKEDPSIRRIAARYEVTELGQKKLKTDVIPEELKS